jgi:hypothetical protein
MSIRISVAAWRQREGGRGSALRVFYRGVGWNLMNTLEMRERVFAGA